MSDSDIPDDPPKVPDMEHHELRKVRRRRLTERLEALRDRAQLIELELQQYTSDFFRVIIFGSARLKPTDPIFQHTFEIAKELGIAGIDVLTGGGPGLMEAGNTGLLEGRKLSGSKSKSFGITIEGLNTTDGIKEIPSKHLDIKHNHRRFSSRLDDFMRLGNVVVAVQGGIGTLLEFFFSWQLLQVGHAAERPIILVDRSYWQGLINWVTEQCIGRGMVSPGDVRWLHIVDTVDEVMAIVKQEHQKFLDRQSAKGET